MSGRRRRPGLRVARPGPARSPHAELSTARGPASPRVAPGQVVRGPPRTRGFVAPDRVHSQTAIDRPQPALPSHRVEDTIGYGSTRSGSSSGRGSLARSDRFHYMPIGPPPTTEPLLNLSRAAAVVRARDVDGDIAQCAVAALAPLFGQRLGAVDQPHCPHGMACATLYAEPDADAQWDCVRSHSGRCGHHGPPGAIAVIHSATSPGQALEPVVEGSSPCRLPRPTPGRKVVRGERPGRDRRVDPYRSSPSPRDHPCLRRVGHHHLPGVGGQHREDRQLLPVASNANSSSQVSVAANAYSPLRCRGEPAGMGG